MIRFELIVPDLVCRGESRGSKPSLSNAAAGASPGLIRRESSVDLAIPPEVDVDVASLARSVTDEDLEWVLPVACSDVGARKH